jgi:hypothetical protein
MELVVYHLVTHERPVCPSIWVIGLDSHQQANQEITRLNDKTMAVWIQNLILLVGVVAAIWYAWETRRLRSQMIRPKVIFLIRDTKSGDIFEEEFPSSTALYARNVGEGTAINVRIHPVHLKDGKLESDPCAISVLEKGQEVQISLRGSGSLSRDLSQILSSLSIPLELTASYMDVENREFTTSTRVGGGAKPPFIRDHRQASS